MSDSGELRDPTTRRCSRCGSIKPIDAFAFSDMMSRTRQSYCRPCHAAYRRAHYERNRAGYISREVARIRRYREENRPKIREYLASHACVDCGEADPVVLEFDHRDRASKSAAVAVLAVQKVWRRVLEEIDKCDVRCVNCHRQRTAAQFHWTKRERSAYRASPDPDRATRPDVTVVADGSAEPRSCTGCGPRKPASDFAYRAKSRGTRRSRCRACMSLYGRAHYARHRDRYAQGIWGGTRGERQRHQRAIADYVRAHPCVDCGERDPVLLEFDHRHDQGRDGRVAHGARPAGADRCGDREMRSALR